MRRSRSATSFCSGNTAFKPFEARLELGHLLAELVQLIGGRRALCDVGAQCGEPLLAASPFLPRSARRTSSRRRADAAEPERRRTGPPGRTTVTC